MFARYNGNVNGDNSNTWDQVFRGVNGCIMLRIMCNKCGYWGHYSNKFPECGFSERKINNNVTTTQNVKAMSQYELCSACSAIENCRNYLINNNWRLIDSCYTVSYINIK